MTTAPHAISLIDSHTHLDAPEFANEVEAVIERAQAAGVRRFISIGATGRGFESCHNVIRLAEQYACVWATVGLHPHQAATPFDLALLRELMHHPRVVAIGETGLDFFRDWAPRDAQERWFRAQIELALECRKPLVIHSREAGEACFKILQEMGAAAVGGVFHCFSEDAAFAERLRALNFMLSIPGSITFKKNVAFREAVRAIPLEQIMLETDAPFLAPEPQRGKRCESAMMLETARMVAQVKQLSLSEIAQITTRNAERFFSLPPEA